jgi:uncharacterized membrane protein YgdD (TMEM256/DUF423 family)
MTGTTWIRLGAILGGLGVIAGAFGAHGLKESMNERSLEVFETAARYQMYHALALLAVGLLALHGRSGASLTLAGWSFLVGTLIFSGTLYALALSGIRWLGAITPIGGVALIVGWFALAVAAGSTSKVAGAEL